MCTLPRRWFCVLTLVLGALSALDRITLAADPAPAASAPWMQIDSGDKYFFLGKSVWDIDAGKLVTTLAAPPNYLYQAHRILGANDRVFGMSVGERPPGLSQVGFIAMLDGSVSKPVTLDDKPQVDANNTPTFFVNADHRRVVWIQQGDYWRGEIDWANSKIINRKQVTSVGAFDNLHLPLLWWDQQLYVWGGFDKEKPFVRINLATGATDELDIYDRSLNLADSRAFFTVASPNHCRVAIATSAIIYSYDARTGKPTLIRNKLEDISAAQGVDVFQLDVLQGTVPLIWADDDTAYYIRGSDLLVKIDFRNARMDIISQPKIFVYGDPQVSTQIKGILPGGHYADEVNNGAGGKGGGGFIERFLLDTRTGQHIHLPFDDKAYGVWLDDSRYLYTVEKGSLSTIGMWLYDRASNSNKRLGGGTIDYGRMTLFKKQNQVWAVTQQSGVSLRRINLDGSGAQDFGPCDLSMPMRMPVDEPVDLGFTNTAIDLWKPTPVDAAALAATQPPEPPAGKLVLLQQIRDLPTEDRTFADNVYDYSARNVVLSCYYDPTKIAMKALEQHKADPKSPFSSFMGNFATNADFSDCLDHDRVARYGHDHALQTIAMDMKLTADQKKQIADRVGQTFADAYMKNPKANPKSEGNNMFLKCLSDARASVTGQPVAASNTPARGAAAQQPANSPQNTQANPPARSNNAGTPPPPPPPPPPPSTPSQSGVDRAAQDAQRAKDAANKLRGLFGH